MAKTGSGDTFDKQIFIDVVLADSGNGPDQSLDKTLDFKSYQHKKNKFYNILEFYSSSQDFLRFFLVFFKAKKLSKLCFDSTWDNSSYFDCDPNEAIFDNSIFSSTLVTEYSLICDRSELNDYGTMVSFIGLFLGAFFGGMAADKFGRKTTMIWSTGATAVALLEQEHRV